MQYPFARIRGLAHANVSGHSMVFPLTPGSRVVLDRVNGASEKEPETQSWLKTIATESPRSTFWDVGANIGLFTLLGAKFGLNVVALEPHPLTFNLLQRAVAANACETFVVPVPLGLSSQTGVANFYIRSSQAAVSGSSVGRQILNAHCIVKSLTTTGDQLSQMLPTEFNQPTAIKLDVDGLEIDILRGLSKTLAIASLQWIMVEELAKSDAVTKILSPYGFVLEHEARTTRNPGNPFVNRYFKRLG